MVLVFDEPISLSKKAQDQPNSLALTQTSRQLRAESGPIYYSSNIFIAADERKGVLTLKKWASSIEQINISRLRRLVFLGHAKCMWMKGHSNWSQNCLCLVTISVDVAEGRAEVSELETCCSTDGSEARAAVEAVRSVIEEISRHPTARLASPKSMASMLLAFSRCMSYLYRGE